MPYRCKRVGRQGVLRRIFVRLDCGLGLDSSSAMRVICFVSFLSRSDDSSNFANHCSSVRSDIRFTITLEESQ